MHLSDRITGSVLIVLGTLSTYGGSRLPPVPGQPVGPNVFPMVVGIGLLLCGLMIVFGIGRSFEQAPVLERLAAEEDEPPPPRGRLYGLRVLLPPALLLLYVFASEPLGFVPTAGLITLITCVSLGGPLRLAVPLALLAPIGVHLVFAKLLRVPLPAGLLPMPW
jgi:putative tricarboxylic transport membrane protein